MIQQFVLGDCMDYLPNFEDNYFDLVWGDYPWGIGEDGRKKRKNTVKQRNGKVLKISNKMNDEVWDNEPPNQDYFNEIFRVGKKHILTGCNHVPFSQYWESSGRIIWDKVNGKNDYDDCEIYWTNLFSSVRQFEYMWNGFLQGESITNGRKARGDKSTNQKKIQFCQKPVNLMLLILRLKAVQKIREKKGNDFKILCTHVGSASDLIACKMEGLQYVGFEKSILHYKNSITRLNNYYPTTLPKVEVFEQTRLF